MCLNETAGENGGDSGGERKNQNKQNSKKPVKGSKSESAKLQKIKWQNSVNRIEVKLEDTICCWIFQICLRKESIPSRAQGALCNV